MDSLQSRVTQWFARDGVLPPICVTLGMRPVSYSKGRAVFSMETGRKYHNPMGTVHGGILTDLADATMGVALITTLQEGESFTTLELKMNFLRPVFGGKLVSEGRVVHRGSTIALVESTIRNDEKKVVAKCIATQMILKANRTPFKKRATRGGRDESRRGHGSIRLD